MGTTKRTTGRLASVSHCNRDLVSDSDGIPA
jgi:hypothetical protein